mgnify:CR=1 FL=1
MNQLCLEPYCFYPLRTSTPPIIIEPIEISDVDIKALQNFLIFDIAHQKHPTLL